jgi:uncharacterized repeat protein (TIGR01451 family)
MKQVEHKILSVTMAIAAGVILFLSLTNPTLAGAESYSNNDNHKTISIDKKLRSIGDSNYVDNIASSTKVFYQDDIIEFQINVTNNGDSTLKNIQVTDDLPPFLKLIFFPGSYDSTNNKVNWTIDQLDAGNTQSFLVRAKIDQAKDVKTLTKETNVAEVKVDELGGRDDASYFIAAGGGISVPNTGDTSLPIKTGIVITLGLAGFLARKKIRGY